MDNFLAYDSLLYALYTAPDFDTMKKDLLSHLNEMIPYEYASILLLAPADEKTGRIRVSEFFCEPSKFMEAEKKYIEKYPDDLDRRISFAKHSAVFRESSLMPESERLHTQVYMECYRPYGVYDTLQLAVSSQNDLLAILTLFRTREHGAFADEDVYLLKALSKHLSTVFYKHCRRTDAAASVSGTVSAITSRVHMTPKETEILTLIFLAKSNPEICDALGIKEHTLQKHFQNIYRKLNISSRWELLRYTLGSGTSAGIGKAG